MSVVSKKKILVINRNYQPVTTITLRRAIKMLCKEDAVIVLPPGDDTKVWQELTWEDWSSLKPAEGESVIKSARAVFKIPEIIRLAHYGNLPSRKVKLSRRAIYVRDKYTCQYCGDRPNVDELSIDHVNPRKLGGKTEWDNVVVACIYCNRKKADKTLKEAGMKLLTKPVMPPYDILRGQNIRVDSWQHFLGDCYWLCPLSE